MNRAVSIVSLRFLGGDPQQYFFTGLDGDHGLLQSGHFVAAVMIRQNLNHSGLRLGKQQPAIATKSQGKKRKQSSATKPFLGSVFLHSYWVM
jgi:hypothetical protein